jgi:hypothetical protein
VGVVLLKNWLGSQLSYQTICNFFYYLQVSFELISRIILWLIHSYLIFAGPPVIQHPTALAAEGNVELNANET